MQLGHTDGGRLVMNLYGHPDAGRMREQLLDLWDEPVASPDEITERRNTA